MASFISATPVASSPCRPPICSRRRNTICVADPIVRAPPGKAKAPPKTYHVIENPVHEQNLPPPPPRHYSVPFIGFFLEDKFRLSTPSSRKERYGPIYRSNFDYMDCVWISDLQAQHELMRDLDTFGIEVNIPTMDIFLGTESGFLKEGSIHRKTRSAMAPAFSRNILPSYFEGIRGITERLWERIHADCKEKKITLDSYMREHYSSIILQLSCGIDPDSKLNATVSRYFETVMAGLIGGPLLPLRWRKSVKASECIGITLRKLIEEKWANEADIINHLRETKNTMRENLKSGCDIMQVALSESEDPNDEGLLNELVDTMRVLWFAGNVTSAVTTLCGIFEMGMDETGEIMRRLVEEQDALVKESGSKQVTYDQVINEMPLLASYITEMLRLHPASNGTMRVAKKNVVILGKSVKQGEILVMDFVAAMRDEAVYEDARKVKVDRFVPEEGKPSPPQVSTFGGVGSAHYCIGSTMSEILMRANLAVMLREYVLQLDPSQSRHFHVTPDATPESKVVLQSIKKRGSVQL